MVGVIRVLALWAAAAAAGAAAEPAADFAPTRVADGRTLVLLGTGERTGDYAMALYVDELDARRAFPALAARAGGRTRARLLMSDHSQSFVIWGHFTKLAVLHLLRAADAATVRGWISEGLADAKAEALLALFDRDLKDGADLTLRSYDDGRIEIDLDGDKRVAPQSPKLARALWKVWLAEKPALPELRRALVDKIDLLGR